MAQFNLSHSDRIRYHTFQSLPASRAMVIEPPESIACSSHPYILQEAVDRKVFCRCLRPLPFGRQIRRFLRRGYTILFFAMAYTKYGEKMGLFDSYAATDPKYREKFFKLIF